MTVASAGQPTVSIVLPVYNAGRLLRPQIDSILKQTYPGWELFLVDDGSTDESPVIAREYAVSHPSIRFRRNDCNQGILDTVNEAIRHVTGDLVALCDHDDIWLPDKIERQVAFLSQQPSVQCVFSDRSIIDLEGRLICLSEYGRTGEPPELADTAFLLDTMARHTHANSLMFRKSLIELAFPIPRGWDWWIAVIASLQGHIGFIRDQLVLYRVHEGSVSSTHRLYVHEAHRRTARREVQESIRRHYLDLAELRIRTSQLVNTNPPVALIDNWHRWYGSLLELLDRPSWQGYRRAAAALPRPRQLRHLLQATLYACPALHGTYLQLAAWVRGY